MARTIIKPNNDEFFTLWVLLAQTKDAILKARHRDLERFHINPERRAILWDIQNNNGQSTPVEIARQLYRELHSVTEMLKRMEKEGLISKSKKSGRASTIIKLTDKGREIFNQSLNNETDERIFSVLPKKRRERLAADLWILRNQALRELGIPEWHIKFPLDPNHANRKNNTANKRIT